MKKTTTTINVNGVIIGALITNFETNFLNGKPSIIFKYDTTDEIVTVFLDYKGFGLDDTLYFMKNTDKEGNIIVTWYSNLKREEMGGQRNYSEFMDLADDTLSKSGGEDDTFTVIRKCVSKYFYGIEI